MTNEIIIQPVQEKSVAVIGAGIFGCLTALKLAEKGFNVTLIDQNHDILFGASYINQNRIHMGYHYPRSMETAKSCKAFEEEFNREFEEAVVDNFDHYYCIANKDSHLTPEDYVSFCNQLDLPFSLYDFTQELLFDSKEIGIHICVPERVYDANILRKKILNRILDYGNKIKLQLSTRVTKITTQDQNYVLSTDLTTSPFYVDSVVNATYSNMNRILDMIGLPVKEYQYELCEIPIILVPWKNRIGFTIMDGPFFGILPFGFSQEYLLYDVELSVLERSVGTKPSFAHDVKYYDDPTRREQRFNEYISKAKRFVPDAAYCRYLYSSYIIRMVLPDSDKDDARPTELLNHGNGIWSIFSGKVTNAIPLAETLSQEMINYFGEKKA